MLTGFASFFPSFLALPPAAEAIEMMARTSSVGCSGRNSLWDLVYDHLVADRRGKPKNSKQHQQPCNAGLTRFREKIFFFFCHYNSYTTATSAGTLPLLEGEAGIGAAEGPSSTCTSTKLIVVKTLVEQESTCGS